MIAYFNGRFIPKEDVKISPDDRGFLFADGAYEVIRSYGGRLFKIEEHLERLKRSLSELLISATIYVVASPFRPPLDKWKNGTNVVLVPDNRWERCDIKSVALLPNVLANQIAKNKGAFEAIFVRDGTITEGSHTNFCAVLDEKLITHPANHRILAGITRNIVLNLCYKLSIPFRETPIRQEELKEASELMILGTTSEILPVVEVDGRIVGDGKPGPITAKLQHSYRKLTTYF